MPFPSQNIGRSMLAGVALTAVLAGCSPALSPAGTEEANEQNQSQSSPAKSPIPLDSSVTPPLDADEAAVLEANRERSRLLVEQRTD